MLTCPVCQAGYEDDKKFCKKCGRPLSPTPSTGPGAAGENRADLRKGGPDAAGARSPRPSPGGTPPERPSARPAASLRIEDADARGADFRHGTTDASAGTQIGDRLRLPAIVASAFLLLVSLLLLIKSVGILIVHGPLRFRRADIPISWVLTFVALGLAAAALFILRRAGRRRA